MYLVRGEQENQCEVNDERTNTVERRFKQVMEHQNGNSRGHGRD